jgi:hypothetical protein
LAFFVLSNLCCFRQRRFKMVIKCTLSVPAENIEYYLRQSWEVMPSPEYINKVGPYVIEQGQTTHQIITTYEFDESKSLEAWECISEELDAFRIIPQFTLSVDILDRGREVKWYRFSLNQGGANPRPFAASSKSFSSPPVVARG